MDYGDYIISSLFLSLLYNARGTKGTLGILTLRVEAFNLTPSGENILITIYYLLLFIIIYYYSNLIIISLYYLFIFYPERINLIF